MKVTNLRQVLEYQLCCGCGLCAYLDPENIVMIDAPAYGRRPKFTEKAEESITFQSILKLCPGVGLVRPSDSFPREEVIESLFNNWGPILDVWEGYAADPEVRFKGSSGGALSAISLYCLEHEGMYGVLHIKADQKRPYLNKTSMSKNYNSILAGTGSRYSPASPCEGLQEIENSPEPSVFIGKPCDVAAVQKARRHNPALDLKVGLTMACFCAGTPSTDGTLDMLQKMGVDKPNDLISLRYRGCGWPGNTRAEKSAGDSIVSRELSYQRSWGDILQKYRQWRCYICPDHTGEFADISLGDPWYKEKVEDEQGLSLILVRTELGRELLKRAIAAGYLTAKKVDPSTLPASQANLLKTRSMLWGRLVALKLNNVPCPSYEGFSLSTSWKTELSVREKVRTFLGTLKRIYKKNLKVKQTMSFDN